MIRCSFVFLRCRLFGPVGIPVDVQRLNAVSLLVLALQFATLHACRVHWGLVPLPPLMLSALPV